jgi:hypothetical protein
VENLSPKEKPGREGSRRANLILEMVELAAYCLPLASSASIRSMTAILMYPATLMW